MAADGHHYPETTDATMREMIVGTGHGRETARIGGEKGAGLEIAATETEGIGTEMDVG